MPRKKESQKELKKMYENLNRFAAQINNPSRTTKRINKTKNKNGLHSRQTLTTVSKRASLEPLDK